MGEYISKDKVLKIIKESNEKEFITQNARYYFLLNEIEALVDKNEEEYLDSTFPGHDDGEWFDITEMLNKQSTVKVPKACQCCSNHPSNGGSGICHCILGNNIRW